MKVADDSMTSRMLGLWKLVLISLSAWVCTCESRLPAAGTRPSVLLIVSDDLTASALSCYGNQICQTPNVDRLANEGVHVPYG